ncbi:MAG: hypothetical protein ABH821_03855 [archaeon]
MSETVKEEIYKVITEESRVLQVGWNDYIKDNQFIAVEKEGVLVSFLVHKIRPRTELSDNWFM